jgi:hypothetical protein
MGTPLPSYDTDNKETHCCSLINPQEWDNQEIVFDEELFVKMKTCSFLYVPLNMGSVMKKTWNRVEKAGAGPDSWVMLSKDLSPWKAEHYLSVKREVPGLKTVKLPGTYLTKVFEGPYKNAPKWKEEMEGHLRGLGKESKAMFFFYTECPRCAKHFGKNYVVLFAQV